MKRGTKWRAYNELAWTEQVIASPAEYAAETGRFGEIIKNHARIKVQTLLHFGCGSGVYDYTFKKDFRVVGVDISKGMLAAARRLNPEVDYRRGDMRTVKLPRTFDAVVLPDCLGYMTTEQDLELSLGNACRHLKPGGALLAAALVREDFRENNFVYTGIREETTVTLFENNCRLRDNPSRYEAVLVYLIRRRDKLRIVTERHLQGLFPAATWASLLSGLGLEIKEFKLKDAYDRFLAGGGEYRLRLFAGRKPLS